MEAAPPTYEMATLTDHWDITARYLPSEDLCAAALVCRRWHATFVPYLWGNPASHFGIENDAVYVALTRFKRTLKTARFLVRSLTHTLHLPPAHAELYEGPHAEWLRDILVWLPNLQSLIVRGLPFFDHAALLALRSLKRVTCTPVNLNPDLVELPGSHVSSPSSISSSAPVFGLRLLDASRCPNITSHSLSQALDRFEALMYLDLSFTSAARNRAVIDTIANLSGLQVLKVRGLSLGDDYMDALCQSVGIRVRSLDVRDNLLSDRSARSLLDHCFLGERLSPTRLAQRSPVLLPYLGSEMLGIYQGEDFEGFLRNAFTGRFIARLAIEDAPDGGITHLYIAGNRFTVEGISGFLRAERLHLLDVGAVVPSRIVPQKRDGVRLPGVEKLTPVLSKYAAESLTFLRIDHDLITKDTQDLSKNETVPGRVELGDSSLPCRPSISELGGTSFRPTSYELSGESSLPRYELAGDQPQVKLVRELEAMDAKSKSQPKRGSIFAAEVAPSSAPEVHVGAVEGSDRTPSTSKDSVDLPSSPYHGLATHHLSVTLERRARLTAHTIGSHNLHPGMIPHVTTLVLTNIPVDSPNEVIAGRLILFIKRCAEEAKFARSHALLDYSLPPGRKGHAAAVEHSSRKTFALRRLVLELATDDNTENLGKKGHWRHQGNKSMTEDRDGEAFWTASETDFSFFGEEECGLPDLESCRSPIHPSSGERVHAGNLTTCGSEKRASAVHRSSFDTISIISAFRKDRKLAHQRKIAAGNSESETEGYWDGVVQVVRSSGEVRHDEETDYYGNKFTNNDLYR